MEFYMNFGCLRIFSMIGNLILFVSNKIFHELCLFTSSYLFVAGWSRFATATGSIVERKSAVSTANPTADIATTRTTYTLVKTQRKWIRFHTTTLYRLSARVLLRKYFSIKFFNIFKCIEGIF